MILGAIMKFELEEYHRNISKEEFIADLKRVAFALAKDSITHEEYNRHGRFNSCTWLRKFGPWAKALETAGLKKTRNYGITNEEYFENLEEVWIKLGRQPYYGEMQRPFSKYSGKAYVNRFETWRKALESFIEYINKDDSAPGSNRDKTSAPQRIIHKHKTKRTINNRLRVQVLIRDGNACKICGRKVTGDDIHIDHVVPWSKGGETVLENLQVLCSICNTGKGDL